MPKGVPTSAEQQGFLRRRPVLAGFLLGIAGTIVVMGLSFTRIVQLLELKAYDRLVQVRPAIPVSDRIVHVDIDDASIVALDNKYPLLRSRYASVVDALAQAGAKQILFDVNFPNQSDPSIARERLLAAERIADPQARQEAIAAGVQDHDAVFAAALGRTDRVYLTFTLDTPYVYEKRLSGLYAKAKAALLANLEIGPDALAAAAGVAVDDVRRVEMSLKRRAAQEYLAGLTPDALEDRDRVTKALIPHYRPGYVSPEAELVEAERRRALAVRRLTAVAALPAAALRHKGLPRFQALEPVEWEFMQHVQHAGFVNVEPDVDGTLRRVPLALAQGGKPYLQLGVRAALDWLGVDVSTVEIRPKSLRFRVGDEAVAVPTDREGRALLNWVNRRWQETFTHVPLAKVVEVRDVRRLLEQNLAAIDARYFRGRRARVQADPNAAPEQVREVEQELLEFLTKNVARGRAMLAKVADPSRAAKMREQLDAIETDLAVVGGQRARAASLSQWLRSQVAGKICIIGDTSTGTTDLHATPVSGEQPGVTVHSNVINMIFQRQFLREAPAWANLMLIAFWGMANTLASLWGTAVRNAARTLALVALSVAVAYLLFVQAGVHVAVFGPLAAQIVAFSSVTIMRQLTEERGKREIRHAFEHYLSPDVVEIVAEDPTRLQLGGEKRKITILFSDIQGFSTVSESLDEHTLVTWLNEYLTEMSDTIMDYGGTVDKYEGDLIMAFFGAPLDMPDHATRTCLAVLENRQKLVELRKDWAARGLPPIYARVGINSGQALVGNLGSHKRLNYSAIGDDVNLAARLEPANKAYGTYLMISEATYEQAKDAVVARELDLLRVVGRWRPVRVFELVGKQGEVDDDTLQGLQFYADGLAYYRERKWREAVELFTQAQEVIHGDPPSQMMMARCGQYLVKPPGDDWDMVFNQQSKE